VSLFGKGSWYNPAGFLGKAGDLKKFAGTKMGSMMSGRAILQGGPKEQNMESARTFDVLGSPATAGTNQQTSARVGAALYGAAMAAGAAGAGGAGSGATAMPPAFAQAPGSVAATQGGTTTAASSTPAWHARMGNAAARGMQQRPQPAPMQTQQPMLDPYGLQASGLPTDMWQDPRLQIIQAMLEQQGVANG
jgi:hypothetical protein